MRILCLMFLFLSASATAQDYEWLWIDDFSGGVRTDVSETAIPLNSAIYLDNAVVEGSSIKLRPGYSLWARRIDSLSTGAAQSPVRGVRGLYEFYNDVTGDRQVLAAIHDEVWWRGEDSIRFHRIGLSSGTVTLTQNDSIVRSTGTDWWPRMLHEDGSDWRLHAGDSVMEVYRWVGNRLLLEESWQPSTLSNSKYELTPIFDTAVNLCFTSFDLTCLIADGSRQVVQWKDNTIQNGFFLIDSVTMQPTPVGWEWVNYTNMHGALIHFIDSLDLPHVDSAQDYGISNYTLAYFDSLTSSTSVHFCPILHQHEYDDSTAPTSIAALYVLIAHKDTATLSSACNANSKAYICTPKTVGYFLDYDTVYQGIIDTMVAETGTGGGVVIDSSQSWLPSDMVSGLYHFIVDSDRPEDIPGDDVYGCGDSTYVSCCDGGLCYHRSISYCRLVTQSVGGTSYTGLRVSLDHIGFPAGTYDGKAFWVLKGYAYPRSAFTAFRQNRLWFAKGPHDPNTLWYSQVENYIGLITNNYFDDVPTANYNVVGSSDPDEITALGTIEQYLVPYKRNHVYVLFNNDSPFEVYARSSGYGLWSDGFLVPYMERDFGLNKLGMFAFDGSSVTSHNQISTAPSSFFLDSLNQSQLRLVRGALYDNWILFSFPDGANTKNTKTLVLDTRNGAWSTWSFAAGSYLLRQAPGSLDTLLWGSPDSSTIFVMGATNDAGSEIKLTYQTPYLDFDTPYWKKQLRKVYVGCHANSGCSLGVSIYANDLQTVEYQDTLVCDTLLGFHSPQVLLLDLPPSIETTTHFSCRLTSINADSLQIDKLGLQYYKTEEVGAQ